MEAAHQIQGHRTRNRRGVRLRVIQGRKQIVDDSLQAAYRQLGEAVSALRQVTALGSTADSGAFGRAGVAVIAARKLLAELAEDYPEELPALPDGVELATRQYRVPGLGKAMAIDQIHRLHQARHQLAPLLREVGREAGRPVPDDLPEGPWVERALAVTPARAVLGLLSML
jgi:hypothetical protein